MLMAKDRGNLQRELVELCVGKVGQRNMWETERLGEGHNKRCGKDV